MESLQSVIQFILNLGAAVFVPALMIIIGLIVRMKVRDAVSAGIILGVAFLGMNIVIGFMIEALTPAAQGLAERTGINLSILDGGWTSMATLAWAWPFAFLMFPLQLGINAIMLVINKTKTLNVDLWNVWGAGYDVAKTLMLAMQAAAALTLFPMVAKLFMQALSPLSDGISEFMKRKFKNRELFIGLDWPILAGCSEVWVAIVLMVPVTLIFALILPGNGVLPFAGILNISLCAPALIVTGGNLIRMIILGTITTPIFLYVSTFFAGTITDLAHSTGAISLKAGQQITWSTLEYPVFRYIFAEASQFTILGFIFVAIWVVLLVFYVKMMKKRTIELEKASS
ncbi:PTS transporter subunit IIC [Listeria monocytogenes]|uniref:PTS transporter subunit IIC n=1 Tax=Listeria monocytogenes TaxID=1639 RepID=UPI000D73F7FC|nr:PTS transporter subunit IIC [Listeria monocytogenes]PXE84163.1 PTS galactitol transporter subunit IIC [Listeria monocytogenes]